MINGRWLLIETLGGADDWSVAAVGTAPRAWKSYVRAVPARLQPLVAAAHAGARTVDQVLPLSRQAWSQQRFRAEPVPGPDGRVHAVQVWVGTGDPPTRTPVASFRIDARTRQVDALPHQLGAHFDNTRTRWIGAEVFESIERFDGALEFTAALVRSAPGSRWLGTATVQSTAGPRAMLLAIRNSAAARHDWLGIALDITASIAPQRKSFEAAAIDMLRRAQPEHYLAIVDTARIRLIRWVTEPVPTMRWRGVIDERSIPHPDDHARIMAARNMIRAGAAHEQLRGVRLASATGDWIVADLEISPLSDVTGSAAPAFALVQLAIGVQEST